MKKNKKFSFLVLMLSIILVFAACGGGDQSTSGGSSSDSQEASEGVTNNEAQSSEESTYLFKLAHITPTTHLWHLAAEKFAEELETKSGGRMAVEIYPAGQLGNEADMVQQIEAGSLDFGFITAAYLSSRSEAFSAWFAPYIFDTYETANEGRHEDVSKKILGTLEEQGLKGLDYFFSGHRVMLFKDKEVKTPEDIQGMALRVTPSPTLQDFYRSLGASPESISLPDVYQAVQTGVIDGMDMDLDATITNNYSEVTQYGAVTNHMVWPSVAIANKNTFEGMSTEDQQIIIDALSVATEWATNLRASQEEEFKETLKEQGMTIYELDKKLFAPYIEQFDEKYKGMDPLIEEFIHTFR